MKKQNSTTAAAVNPSEMEKFMSVLGLALSGTADQCWL